MAGVQLTVALDERRVRLVIDRLKPALYLPAIRTLLESAGALAVHTAREAAGPADQGHLAESLTAHVEPLTLRLESMLSYARAVDDGRRPGARMPPPDALAGWASRHGITIPLFVLARAIGRRGIKGRHFLHAAHVAVAGALPMLIRHAQAEINRRWSA